MYHERLHHRAGALCCGLVFESDASSAAFLTGLCSHVLNHRDPVPHDRFLALCHRELMDKCNIDLEDVVKSDVDGAVVDRRLSSKFHGRVRAQNLTRCLEVNFGIDENLVRAEKSYHKPSDVFYPRKPWILPALFAENFAPMYKIRIPSSSVVLSLSFYPSTQSTTGYI